MDASIITLATHSFERAHIVKSILESEGIECFLEHVNLIQGAISSGVMLKINKDDLEKALEVVESIKEAEFEKQHLQFENTILVPVDFSDYSTNAVNFAFDWAVKLNAKIILFHAYYNPIITTIPFSDAYVYDINSDDLMMDIVEKAESDMLKVKTYVEGRIKAVEECSVTVSSMLVRGIAEEEIVRYTRKKKPHLVVMGTRGKDKKNSDLIGSVTAEVIEMAKVPVLAIPEGFVYEGFGGMKNLLYATNFDQKDFDAIDILEELVKPLGLKIICAHVGLHDQAKWDAVRMKALREHFKKQYNDTEVECELVEHEDFWVGMEAFVQDKKIDIISITTHRRGLMSRLLNPSVAKKMLFHSNTPLLVFHA